MVESTLADWDHDDTADGRTDTVLIGDTIVRVGVNDRAAAIVGFTPFGHVRTRDTATGTVDRRPHHLPHPRRRHGQRPRLPEHPPAPPATAAP